jgi:hypothetical protein
MNHHSFSFSVELGGGFPSLVTSIRPWNKPGVRRRPKFWGLYHTPGKKDGRRRYRLPTTSTDMWPVK